MAVRDDTSNETSAASRLIASLALCAGLLPAFATPAAAQGVALAPFGGQTFDSPYHVTSPPGDPERVFVVEGTGAIRLVRNGVTQPTPFLDIGADVWDGAEGGCECGLFSMAVAPDYAESGRFYVFYTRDFNPGFHYLRIEEFRRSAANPDLADPASRRIVMEIPHLEASNHNGGQLQFGPDGYLYIWVGDGGPSQNAQNLSLLVGKLLRIDPAGAAPFQYTVPADNPFAAAGGPRDEIYAYGLRNPWRGSFDRSTGDLTIGDVGAGSWEEIDFKPEGTGLGANFGWNCFEGTAVFSGCAAPNHSPPVLQYANGGGGAAITGGVVFRDSALPSMAGRYVYGDTFDALGGQLRSVALAPGSASGDAPLGISLPGVVSFGQDACGHVYATTLSGQVGRFQPTSGPFPCKLAPELSILGTKGARQAAKRRAVTVRVACDEDCTVSAQATIRLKGRKQGRSAKAGRLKGTAAVSRLQLNQPGKVRVTFTRKQAKRLRKALRAGRRAVARISVTATGGGGGTDGAKREVKQRR